MEGAEDVVHDLVYWDTGVLPRVYHATVDGLAGDGRCYTVKKDLRHDVLDDSGSDTASA